MLGYDFFKEFFTTAPTLDGCFKVLQTIGEGRYAKVKLAISLEDRKKYAVKIMREDQVNTPSKLEAFFNEVRILSSISHKNLVQIVRVSIDGEYRKPNGTVYKVVYYIMKYAEFGELFEILQQFESFPEKIARHYFHQLIQAVEYLHDSGIGHRDIKTENILIDNKYDLKLADFGCAAHTRDHKSQRLTFDNQVPIGSPEYNAPEITNNEFQQNYFAEGVDVFASASTLFVMMLKSIPFNSSLFSDPYYSRLCKKDTSQFWKIFDPSSTLSLDYKDLIERMMHPNPQKRISIKEIKTHPWYMGPLPQYSEIVGEMTPRAEAIRASNMEKLHKRHVVRMRKAKEVQSDSKMFMFRPNSIDLEHLKDAMRHSIEEINLRLKQDADEMKLAKMMNRVAEQTQAQIAKNKEHKGGKGDKTHRKNRNSDTILPNDKPAIPDYEAPKLPRKQSRSFAGEASSSQDDHLNQAKMSGSGAPFAKGERMRMRRSGSDD